MNLDRFPYFVETEFGGKYHWLDSFETLADALHVAIRKRCNWRIVRKSDDLTVARSV